MLNMVLNVKKWYKMVLEDSSCCTNCQYAVVVNILLDLFHVLQMG